MSLSRQERENRPKKLIISHEDFFKRIGKIGGQNGTGHAFAHGKLDPSETGKLSAGIPKRFVKVQ